jgi:hypothetical protein
MTFWEKLLLDLQDRIAKLAESSGTTLQRNILRGCSPKVVRISQLLRGTNGVQPPKTIQKNYTNEGISLDLSEVSYGTSKSNQS